MIKAVAVHLCFSMTGVATAFQLPPVPDSGKSTATPTPTLYVAQRRLDIGDVIEGDKRPVEWLLENKGTAPLVIDRTKAGCGCTVVNLKDEDKIIPPGGRLTLKARFDSTARHGVQNKNVIVYSNDPAEPELNLRFTADVKTVYLVTPPGLVNLQSLQRGQQARRTVEFRPGPGRNAIEIVHIQLPDRSPIRLTTEAFPVDNGTGQRLKITVADDVSVGSLTTKATVKILVDDIERTRVIPIRGEIVGDLTWQPKVLDTTRMTSRPGKRLAPVRIRSTEKAPFDILSASAGPAFDVAVEPAKSGPRRTRYALYLTLRDNAPPGPFATTLEIRTTSLTQPLARVPVYGEVARRCLVDPPLVLLRQDGTPLGTRRRVKLQATLRDELKVTSMVCDTQAVTVALDEHAGSRYRHIVFLDIRLEQDLPAGRHEATLTVSTNIAGAREITIPIQIEVP